MANSDFRIFPEREPPCDNSGLSARTGGRRGPTLAAKAGRIVLSRIHAPLPLKMRENSPDSSLSQWKRNLHRLLAAAATAILALGMREAHAAPIVAAPDASTSAPSAAATPRITWPAPAAIVYGTPLSAKQLDATASVPGGFAYSPTTGLVLAAGGHTLTVTFTPSVSGYQRVTATVALAVTRAQLTVTAKSLTKVYGAAMPALSAAITGFVNRESAATAIEGAPSLSTVATAKYNVGSYAIVAARGTLAAANYTFRFVPGTVTITKATLDVAAGNAEKLYGAPLPRLSATITGLVNGDLAVHAITGAPTLATPATAKSPAGVYAIAPSLGTLAARDYSFRFTPGALTVAKTSLTVTAASASVIYNQPLPKLTYDTAGFVNGDTATVLRGAPSESTSAQQGSPTGTYPIRISQGTLTAANYVFRLVNGVLTITPQPLTAPPAFKPAAGTYSSAQSVTLSSPTPEAIIYYTTNGTTPTKASTKYTGAIPVSASETIEAIAIAPGDATSAVSKAAYAVTPVNAPTIATVPAQNGAVVVTLASDSYGANIYYTLNGATPGLSSQIYQAPFLLSSNLTVSAIASIPGYPNTGVVTRKFTPDIPSGALVWSDEFANSSGSKAEPNPDIWTYDTGNSGFGNNELENYCAWGSTAYPCEPSNPNAYVGTDGSLHIMAEQPSSGVYTSARMKSQGLFSFQYGRLEVRAKVPEGQGFWPAIWMLGNNINTINWPACGEQDMVERIDAAATPDWNAGSVHGTGFTGANLGTQYDFPNGQTAAGWHVYGMIWKPGSISYYVDDPAKPYANYTPASLSGLGGAVWPFDTGPGFLIMNVAVGGDWPGSPNSNTVFPSEMVVDYVRIYAN